MKYPAPDGHIIESSQDNPVIYTCPAPSNWSDGTYESLETAVTSKNELVQIKIVRVVSNGTVEITVTERTPVEIAEYIKNIEQNAS